MTDDDTLSARQVTDALARYRDADSAMRSRARTATAMTENEMRIVQFLLVEATATRPVKPIDIARHLGVTSASMTALLDRLERAGAIARVPHPTDRRSLLITATPDAVEMMGSTVVAFELDTRAVAEGLTPGERDAVVSFLDQLTDAADAISRSVRV